jgi:hypothetical protein
MEVTQASAEMIFDAFSVSPEIKQAQIEAEFQKIGNMGFQGGVKALIEEANDHPHFNASLSEAINTSQA